MNKKWAICLLAVAMTVQGTVLWVAEGTSQMNSQIQQVQEEKNEYFVKQGKITEISMEDETYSVLVGTPLDGTRFIVDNGNIIVDAETLDFLKADQIQEGMTVTVVVPMNAPMTLSIPPMVSSQTAIIVNSDKRFVEEGFFDETLTNEANTLALNIDKETSIMNTIGERRVFTAEDIKNKNAVVVYTASTRSIPAQTAPKWVLILPTAGGAEAEETSEISQQQAKAMKQDQKDYISVRKMAETYGYAITWDNQTKTAALTKGDTVITLTAGEKEYTVNNAKNVFGSKAKLEQDGLFVSSEILDIL